MNLMIITSTTPSNNTLLLVALSFFYILVYFYIQGNVFVMMHLYVIFCYFLFIDLTAE